MSFFNREWSDWYSRFLTTQVQSLTGKSRPFCFLENSLAVVFHDHIMKYQWKLTAVTDFLHLQTIIMTTNRFLLSFWRIILVLHWKIFTDGRNLAKEEPSVKSNCLCIALTRQILIRLSSRNTWRQSSREYCYRKEADQWLKLGVLNLAALITI